MMLHTTMQQTWLQTQPHKAQLRQKNHAGGEGASLMCLDEMLSCWASEAVLVEHEQHACRLILPVRRRRGGSMCTT